MNYLALDTETTGLTPHHGCRPFAVSTCSLKGIKHYWDTFVCPQTREVQWKSSVTREILAYLKSYDGLVLHNIRFDLRALAYMFEDTSPRLRRDFINHLEHLAHHRNLHCTMARSHVLNSKGVKGLKAQAVLNLGILDTDEKELDEAVKHIRRIVKSKYQWRIAEEGLQELGGIKDGFHKMDMWLPKAYAKRTGLPLTHPYWTVCKKYAMQDALRTAGLYIVQENTFTKYPELVVPYQNQQDIILPIFHMENEGITILDSVAKEELSTAKQEQLDAGMTMARIANSYGFTSFNPNSHPNLKAMLFTHLKFKPIKLTDKNTPSTDKTVLPELGHQDKGPKAKKFLDALIRHREVGASVRYLESYNRFRIGNHLYPSLNTEGTSTTRLSSQNPNGQNIGKGKESEGYDADGNLVRTITHSIRKVFGPMAGDYWLAIDYDQLQIRIFAYWSKEPKLIEAIESGFDFHDFVAKMIFETEDITKAQRKVAKYVNFGIIFGAGSSKIDSMCGIPGTHAKVLKIFPNVAEALSRTGKFVRQNGYVKTASGYRLIVPKNKPYAGVNYIVQGTEGDIVKRAIASCQRTINNTGSHIRMMLPVHDEILFRCPRQHTPPLLALTQDMEEAGDFYGVKCKAKTELIIDNWASGQPIPNDHFKPKGKDHAPTRRRQRPRQPSRVPAR